MERNKPKAVSCHTAYGSAIQPMPDDINIKKLMQNDRVYLYNPFVNGQRFTPKSPSAISMYDLKKNFLVENNRNSDVGSRDSNAQMLFSTQEKAWSSLLDYVSHQLATEITMEPRDRKKRLKLTPEDIKLAVSAPNQALKPKGLSRSPKMAPPKPR
jgi:hypothetical protein